MPVRKVRGGWRYGTHGKIYRTRWRAARQGRAIAISKARQSGYYIPRLKNKKSKGILHMVSNFRGIIRR